MALAQPSVPSVQARTFAPHSTQNLLITHSQDKRIDAQTYVRLGVAETLITVDKQGKLKPQLAKKWSVNNEKTIWTLTLRKNVFFSNKKPVNAKAVIHALRMAQQRDTPLKNAPIVRIEEKNGKVVITVYKAYSMLPAVLAHYSSLILSPDSYNSKGNIVNVIGTGSLILNERESDYLTLKKNTQYWGKKASITHVKYQLVPQNYIHERLTQTDINTGIMAFGLSQRNIQRLSQNPRFEVATTIKPRVVFLKLNQHNDFLKDDKVRNALSLAIDRNSLSSALMRTPDIKTSQLFPPTFSLWHNTKLHPLTFNIKEAKAVLEKAGFRFDSQGYAYKKEKYITLNMQLEDNYLELQGIETVLTSQLKKIGIKLQIQKYPDALQAFENNQLDILLTSRDYGQIQSPLELLSKDMNNKMLGWDNTRFYTALNYLKLDNTDKRAKKHRLTITKILHEELPIIPILWYEQRLLSSKRLQHVTLTPFENNYYLNQLKLKPRPLTNAEKEQYIISYQRSAKLIEKLLKFDQLEIFIHDQLIDI